jgi:hypothetical protein
LTNSLVFPAKVIRAGGNLIETKFMAARSFFDTNILIYADDSSAPKKKHRALELISEHRRAGTGVVSLQILQEYFVTVTKNCESIHGLRDEKWNCSPNSTWLPWAYRTF